jgi:RNA polymerase sigma-B factor
MIDADRQMDFGFDERTRESRDGMVVRYRYLCRRGALKYARRYEDRADFEQIAALGLIKAVDRYKPELKTPFEAYAWLMIQGELSHYVRDFERLVRPPRRMRELDRSWKDARRALQQHGGGDPSDGEIRAHLGWDNAVVCEHREYQMRETIASLDSLPPHQAVSACYTIDSHTDRLMLEKALAVLKPVERTILHASLEHGWSVTDIAERLGYSTRHVTRLRRAAIAKLALSNVLTAV